MLVTDAVPLMRMEYAEFPELKLTFGQARRLWNLSDDECAAALKTLVEARFLARSAEGQYVRHRWSVTSVTSPAASVKPGA